MVDFVHLHVHTHYSVLDGMSKIPDLVAKAKRSGMSALAITDHGNMFGMKEFMDIVGGQNKDVKGKIKEQEAILLTFKVYTQVNLTQLHGDTPDLKGFHTQEVELPQQKTFSLEHYNGRNYNTTIWQQFVLFPQRSGKLEIPSVTFEGTVALTIFRFSCIIVFYF